MLYTASLSTYYVFSIRNGWPRTKIENAEKWLHIGPIVFSIATMIPSLVLGLYNSSDTVCHIAALPHGCEESWQSKDGTTTCTRGDNATLYNLLFNLVPKWTSILIVTVNMVVVYLSVRKRERRGRRWSIHGSSAGGSVAPLRMTTQIAQQCYLFVGALYLTNFMGIAVKAGTLSKSAVPFGVMLTSSILLPTQGLWNTFVYLRPRYLSIQRAKRMSSLQMRRRRSSAGPLVPSDIPVESGVSDDSEDSPSQRGASGTTQNAIKRALTQLRASGYKSSQLLSSVIEAVQHGGLKEPDESGTSSVVQQFDADNTNRSGGDHTTSSCPAEDCFEENMTCDKSKVRRQSSGHSTDNDAEETELSEAVRSYVA